MPSGVRRSASAPFLDLDLDRAADFQRRSRRSKTPKLEPLGAKASMLELPALQSIPALQGLGDRAAVASVELRQTPQAPAPSLLSRRRTASRVLFRLDPAAMDCCEDHGEEAPAKEAASSKLTARPSSISSASTRPPSTLASSSTSSAAVALPTLVRAAASAPSSPEAVGSPAPTARGEAIETRKPRRKLATRGSVSSCASALSEAASASPRRLEGHAGGASASRPGVPYRWKCGERIGSGAFGTVFKALNVDQGLIFAVKKTALPAGEDEQSKWRNELDICEDLRHPHIVCYLGHEFMDDSLYIHMEYLSGGSLASVVKEFGALTCPLLKKATRGMAEGLDYLHSRSPPVVHRDIKGANVLVGSDFCVKLADFGCSKRSDVTASLTVVGSIPWMAPEVINQEGGHGRKADVWSLGCVVIEMATAEKPWGSGAFDNPFAAMWHIGMSSSTPPIPDSVDTGARALAAWCTRRSKADRPTSSELLLHDFIND